MNETQKCNENIPYRQQTKNENPKTKKSRKKSLRNTKICTKFFSIFYLTE